MTEREPWVPRSVRRLGQWTSGAVPLKAYAILADPGAEPDPALAARAAEVVARAAPRIAATAQEEIGFVILHQDGDGAWLLLHWWIAGGTCAQLIWHGPPDAPTAFIPLDRPAMACIWELALIDHERRAYVRSLAGPGDGRATYLQDIYSQDFC